MFLFFRVRSPKIELQGISMNFTHILLFKRVGIVPIMFEKSELIVIVTFIYVAVVVVPASQSTGNPGSLEVSLTAFISWVNIENIRDEV